MKFLKYFLYVIGVLILIAIILGLTGPKSFDFSRSIVIEARPDQVWQHISSLKKMGEWAPWSEGNPSMVIEYSGDDGQIGSYASWTSKQGKGRQVLSKLEPYKEVESQLTFKMPWGESHPVGYIHLADRAGSTKTTWGIKGENDFVGRIFGSLMSMDKTVGPEFDKGLNKLKSMVEESAKTSSGKYRIDNGNYPGGKYIAVRATNTFEDRYKFYIAHFTNLINIISQAGAKMEGFPSGFYYTWDTIKQKTDMAAAVGFSGAEIKAPEGMQVITLPSSRYLTTDYYGGYYGIGKAHDALREYIRDYKLEHVPPAIEAYITDPMAELDSMQWLTKVVYFIK